MAIKTIVKWVGEGVSPASYEIRDNAGTVEVLQDGVVIASGAQQTAVADSGAVTAYTAHTSGATPVTSNAATDLDTTAAGLATLEDEVTDIGTQLNAALAALRAYGLIAT